MQMGFIVEITRITTTLYLCMHRTKTEKVNNFSVVAFYVSSCHSSPDESVHCVVLVRVERKEHNALNGHIPLSVLIAQCYF